MRAIGKLGLAAVLAAGLAACGGGATSSGGGASGPGTNKWSGAIAIDAGPATTCAAPTIVTFHKDTGADVRDVHLANGGCIRFRNLDDLPHQPASYQPLGVGAVRCPELDFPAPLDGGASSTVGPLSGPRTCAWEDLQNPPPVTGGGTGVGGY